MKDNEIISRLIKKAEEPTSSYSVNFSVPTVIGVTVEATDKKSAATIARGQLLTVTDALYQIADEQYESGLHFNVDKARVIEVEPL